MTAPGTGRLVRHLATVDSTNEHALAMAAAGAPDGAVVVADEQTAGRGRRGRAWHSPEGGLYLSYIVRDIETIARPSLLTLAAGVAAARAIADATGFEPDLKWPNDVLTPGRPRKLAGILAEASSVGSRVDVIVIGIGINVSMASVPAELQAIAASLEGELGRDVGRQALQDALIERLDAEVARLRAGGEAQVLDEWRARSPGSRGARVSWREAGGERIGVTEGIDADGALLVRGADGVQRLVAGEVIWT
ncbi:MAG TPA: biotin--[acetyl-CoA-carboxylase] ligase [Vicinamibacterales bacterium]|nr:biotin--[acetyl-CoA-carboxylase] ligase [Vicinamibacterales bacterium]